ncbi:MAG: hypothetical protein ACLQGP_36775 [Isosphaeraceae bacterium]
MAEFKVPAKDGRPEVTVPGHRKVFGVRSQSFKSWLLVAYYDETEGAPSGEALSMATRTLEAKACHRGDKREVFIRVGAEGDSHYLDLCNDWWQVVRVDAGSWEVVPTSPAAFRRSSGMMTLPTPVRGGSLELLRKYVNVASDDDFRLLVGWLLSSFRPNGPYPILILQGEQGSCKSTTSRVLRRLVDPHAAMLRSEPKNIRDLMISAYATWLTAYDNLSGVPSWLSDAMCRLATGGGFTARALYSDEDEVQFAAMRPILLNGIDDVAERPDLLDRAVLLRLPTIEEEDRQEEAVFWKTFEFEQALILGALLDTYAKAVKLLPDVRLDSLPRMADFCRFGEAVGRAAGWGENRFQDAYRSNIEGGTNSAAEASPVATAVRMLMSSQQEDWKGTCGELLEKLTLVIGEQQARSKTWPSEPRKISGDLTRLAPVLRRLGIYITRLKERSNRGSQIVISRTPPLKVEKLPSLPSQPSVHLSQTLENKGFSSDSASDGTVTVGDGTVTVDDQHTLDRHSTVTRPSLDMHDPKSIANGKLGGVARPVMAKSDGSDGRSGPLRGDRGSDRRKIVEVS